MNGEYQGWDWQYIYTSLFWNIIKNVSLKFDSNPVLRLCGHIYFEVNALGILDY